MSELVTARIRATAAKLGLPHLTETLTGHVQRADAAQMGYLDFLDLILEEELAVREDLPPDLRVHPTRLGCALPGYRRPPADRPIFGFRSGGAGFSGAGLRRARRVLFSCRLFQAVRIRWLRTMNSMVAMSARPRLSAAADHRSGLPEPRLLRNGDHGGNVDDSNGIPCEQRIARLRSVDSRGYLDTKLLCQPGYGSIAA